METNDRVENVIKELERLIPDDLSVDDLLKDIKNTIDTLPADLFFNHK